MASPNLGSESINAKIQSVKYTARGFRNKQNFVHAIYFHYGGLDLAPYASRPMDSWLLNGVVAAPLRPIPMSVTFPHQAFLTLCSSCSCRAFTQGA